MDEAEVVGREGRGQKIRRFILVVGVISTPPFLTLSLSLRIPRYPWGFYTEYDAIKLFKGCSVLNPCH